MKISVAMCTYNGELYLDEQLHSIIKQSIPVDEIVICDDGSSDSTMRIIQKNIHEGAPIRVVVNRKNLGYTKNFEKAICLCSGDIIFLADQDDIWLPDKVKTILDHFESHPNKDFVFTDGILINHMGTECFDKTLFEVVGLNKRNLRLFDEGSIYDVLGVSGKVTGATVAFRASFIPYFLPFHDLGKLAIHDGMMAATAVIWNKISYIKRPLIKYRIHYSQSVGLGFLFRYPTRSYEFANNVLMWHLALVEKHRPEDARPLHMFYKRFWTIRSNFGAIILTHMFMRGEYRLYGTRRFKIYYRDMKGIAIRCMEKILYLKRFFDKDSSKV